MEFDSDCMENPEEVNTQELAELYGYRGKLGEFRLKSKLLRCYLLQLLASISPSPSLAVLFRRAKG